MGHFANQYWKSYSGLFAEWGSALNDADTTPIHPFDTGMPEPVYLINTSAPRNGFVRISYHLSIYPDWNPEDLSGNFTLIIKYTNPAGTNVTITSLDVNWLSAVNNLDGGGFYPAEGIVHFYAKENTPIQVYAQNTGVWSDMWGGNGYINGNITVEYDR